MGDRTARILIVEDDPDIREGIVDCLNQEPYEVVAVDTGRQALELLQAQTFDLAVIDVQLPDVSGLDVLSSFRAQFASTPVIVASAQDRKDFMNQAMRRGATLYLRKPVPPEFLFGEINRLLGRAASSEERSTGKG